MSELKEGELLPCPHCGSSSVALNNDEMRWRQVICGGCGARGCEHPDDTDKAIRSWNIRATRPAQEPAGGVPSRRPVAFRALARADSKHYLTFDNEAAAVHHCEANGVEYEGLYLVASRATPAPQPGMVMVPMEADAGLEFAAVSRAFKSAVLITEHVRHGLDTSAGEPGWFADVRKDIEAGRKAFERLAAPQSPAVPAAPEGKAVSVEGLAWIRKALEAGRLVWDTAFAVGEAQAHSDPELLNNGTHSRAEHKQAIADRKKAESAYADAENALSIFRGDDDYPMSKADLQRKIDAIFVTPQAAAPADGGDRPMAQYIFTSDELASYIDKVREAWEAQRAPADGGVVEASDG